MGTLNNNQTENTDKRFTRVWYNYFLSNVKHYHGSDNPYELKISEMVEYIELLHKKLDGLLQPVKAVQGESGDWFIIPLRLADEFNEDLQDDDFIESGDFDEKYVEYLTNGDLNNIQLYAEIKSVYVNVLRDKQLARNKMNGTSRKGYIKATYNQLVSVLGEPSFNTPSCDNKTQVEWVVEFEGEYFAIYDWKVFYREYTLKELDEFNVGGMSDASKLIAVLEEKIK
jgi:hypothetical protein